MKEPLNYPTAYRWPHWHNQPLHLTKQEMEQPTMVLDQFFQCYHLPDIRDCLNNWLLDALAKDSIECKQHVATNKEVLKLAEAAWLILQNSLSKSNIKDPLNGREKNEPDDTSHVYDSSHKPKRLIEKASEDPNQVIQQVFTNEYLSDIKDNLADWLHVAMVADRAQYQTADQRACLLSFYELLLLLIEALFVIIRPQLDELNDKDQPALLTGEQIANPSLVITGFFKRFSITYVRRELWDWFQAGITFSGTWPENLWPDVVFNLYDYVSCLTEAAYALGNHDAIANGATQQLTKPETVLA